MKTLIACTSIVASALTFQSCSTFTDANSSQTQHISTTSAPVEYSNLLEKYVTPTGVRYLDWSKNTADLDALKRVTDYYALSAPPADKQESLAWHLNAYNAWILHNILEQWPNQGPLDVSLLFFHKKSITISGKRISLQHLETPFTAKTLDKTLQQLTKDFINHNPLALVESEDSVKLSKIFEWYKDDFGGDDQLINYINQYRDQKISTDKKVKFLSYDWNLNKTL